MKTITYEYLGQQFVEDSKHWEQHVNDNGEIVRGYYENVWMPGSESIKEADVKSRVAVLKKIKTYRNIQIH